MWSIKLPGTESEGASLRTQARRKMVAALQAGDCLEVIGECAVPCTPLPTVGDPWPRRHAASDAGAMPLPQASQTPRALLHA